MSNSDLVLNNREILPMSDAKFGVVITDEEHHKFLNQGYKVKFIAPHSGEKTTYYLEVTIGAHQREDIDLAILEWAGRADVVFFPYFWRLGKLSGVKAFVRSVNILSAQKEK